MTDPVTVIPDAPNNPSIPVIDPPKPSWCWIRDSKGNSSASLTFATIAFYVTTIVYVLSCIQKIGPLEVRPFDVAACGAYLIPCMMLYFGRRQTAAKYGEGDK